MDLAVLMLDESMDVIAASFQLAQLSPAVQENERAKKALQLYI